MFPIQTLHRALNRLHRHQAHRRRRPTAISHGAGQPTSRRFSRTFAQRSLGVAALCAVLVGCTEQDARFDPQPDASMSDTMGMTDTAEVLDTTLDTTDTTEDEEPVPPVIDGNARFTVITPTLIRLEYAEDGQFEDRPTQTIGTRPPRSTPFVSRVENGARIVETEALTLTYRPDTGPFSPDNLDIVLRNGSETIVANPVWGPDNPPDDEHLGGWRRGLDLVQSPQPYQPGLLTRRGWYLLDDSASALLTESSPGFATRPTRQGAYQDGYFFGYGRNYRTALADLRELAGPAPLLPKKALGVWFSRYWPYSDAEWRELVALFRMKNVPLDVLSLDTDWKSSPEMNVCASINAITGAPPDAPCSWNGWDWNTMLYPDPNGFMDWAHAQGLQIGLNIHPSINGGDPAYAQVVAIAGELEPDPTPLPCDILQADLSNPCLVFDWTNPAHIEAYFGLHAPIASAGVDFWWLDWCCEGSSAVAPGLTPDTWINSLYLEEHRRLGSRWPSFSRIGGSFQVGADARDEGQGAFAEHRMSIHFTGDTCSTWELLRYVAEFTVVEGASIGLPYISHDIGSFHGFRPGATTCTAVALTPTLPDDMYVRWVQFGTFQPLDRLHSQHGERLPWDYPGEAETIATAFLRLRGRLVPHLYTLSREAYDTGLPMARALYLQWPEHDEAYADPSSFTLGDDLLVATVASPGQEAEVDVWLPPGTWVDYFTGERLEGPGMVQRTVPLDRYPVFARLGTILPTQPDLPTSADGPQDNLTLNIWPGADGAYTLYEDEGIGFAFEAGAYQRTHIALSSPDPDCSTVTVQASEGAPFPGALAERSWTLRFVGLDSPTQVTLDGLPVASAAGEPPVWTYDASTQTLTMETGLVSTEQDLHVQVGSRCP